MKNTLISNFLLVEEMPLERPPLDPSNYNTKIY